jgi:Uma2 family endonuclease
MAQTKLAGAWSSEDILSFPDDGRRFEIIEGDLYEMPSPTSVHAATIINLIALLPPIVARLRGRVFTAPLDVSIPGGDPVQPDVLVVLPNGNARVELRGIEGPPDLVIEVVRPSNRGRDLLTKRSLYARAGVREYWLVDPDARTVEILTLDRDAFHLAAAASGDETLVSPLLGSLPAPVDDLFAGIDS